MENTENTVALTVIVPCYQVAPYLDRCLKTLTEQTIGIEQMEIILIDDGSTDGTVTRCNQWKNRYPKQISVIALAENQRQGYCRNLGMQRAKGTYIAFVDADDWIEPDMYEKMIDIAEQTGCELVECGCSRDRDMIMYGENDPNRSTGHQNRLIRINTEEERSLMIAANLLKTYVVTKLYRRTFLEQHQIHFAEHMIYEDVFFIGLLNVTVSSIGFLEQKMYHYFINPNSVSLTRNTKAHYDIVRVNRALFEEYEKRNLPEGIQAAVRFDLLCTYYLTAMKMLAFRFDKPPVDLFRTVQRDIRKMVPDAEKNPYVEQYTTAVNKAMLKLIPQELTEADLMAVAQVYREHSRKRT